MLSVGGLWWQLQENKMEQQNCIDNWFFFYTGMVNGISESKSVFNFAKNVSLGRIKSKVSDLKAGHFAEILQWKNINQAGLKN